MFHFSPTEIGEVASISMNVQMAHTCMSYSLCKVNSPKLSLSSLRIVHGAEFVHSNCVMFVLSFIDMLMKKIELAGH